MENSSTTPAFSKTSQSKSNVSTQKPRFTKRRCIMINRFLFTTLLLITLFTIPTLALPIDYEYQVDSSPQLEQVDLPETQDHGIISAKCQEECEIGTAKSCLHCLRFIDAKVLSQDNIPLELSEDDVETNVNQIMGPLLWTSTIHYPANRLSIQAQQLLQRLQEAQRFQRSNSNSRAHKKDLRMTLQRRLSEQNINALLKNNWVG